MGPFDNRTGKYVQDNAFDDGLWLEHGDGRFWIIPTCYDTIDGPEDAVFDALNVLARQYPDLTDIPKGELDRLGLTVIPASLKRFTEEDGYYHA